MKRWARKLFSWFTAVLLVVCIWTAYWNVLSDDTAVRAQAREAANKFAGCGDKCKLTGMRGERGMITEAIEFDIDGHGTLLSSCRRKYIVFGDYACEVSKGK
jgi:hypothetical protein